MPLTYPISTAIVSFELLQIFSQQAFDQYRGEELSPGIDCQTDGQLNEFVRASAETAYHPSCTCRMGPADGDETVVVDPECRVIGVDGLRIVDASIMPSIITGNLNGPVIMMAEKASDMILGRNQVYSDVKGASRL
jgi:choline dehydrogenase